MDIWRLVKNKHDILTKIKLDYETSLVTFLSILSIGFGTSKIWRLSVYIFTIEAIWFDLIFFSGMIVMIFVWPMTFYDQNTNRESHVLTIIAIMGSTQFFLLFCFLFGSYFDFCTAFQLLFSVRNILSYILYCNSFWTLFLL